MDDNVVEIEEFRFTRASRYHAAAECAHRKTRLDPHGQIIVCQDCHQQVSAWWVVNAMLDAYTIAQGRLQAREKALEEAQAKSLVLLAAQRIERAWRRRDMLPTCPHCGEGIAPEDGLGSSIIHREIAARRDAVRDEAAHEAAGSKWSKRLSHHLAEKPVEEP
jgi:hypothetical protein